MGSAKSAGRTPVRLSRAQAWRGPIVSKSPIIMWPCPAATSAFPVLLAVEEVTKHVYGEAAEATPENAAAFLDRLVAEFPQKIDAVTTDIRPAFTHCRGAFGEVHERDGSPVLTPSRSPAARTGSSTNGQFCSLSARFSRNGSNSRRRNSIAGVRWSGRFAAKPSVISAVGIPSQAPTPPSQEALRCRRRHESPFEKSLNAVCGCDLSLGCGPQRRAAEWPRSRRRPNGIRAT